MPEQTPDDDLLNRAAKVAFAGVEEDSDISVFPRPRQVFIIIYTAQGIIDNGGFEYFFESDWPDTPPYSRFSDAYREIGASDVAEWIERATTLFGVPDPHLHRELRLEYLKQHCQGDSGEMVELGDRAIRESARVFRLLAKYVRQHASEFQAA